MDALEHEYNFQHGRDFPKPKQMKIFVMFISLLIFNLILSCENKSDNSTPQTSLILPDTKDPIRITKDASFSFQQSKSMDIKGYPGEIIDKCIVKRIKGQDVDHLIEPFTLKNETSAWQSEFLGKWMLSAVAAYQYNKDEGLLEKIKYAASGLMATQLANGYIGNYGPDTQLKGWDIWGRKYSMLGLIRYYEISGDTKALVAASRVADHLIGQVGPDRVNIIKTGFYRGMASSSVLEPIVYLYNHTGQKKYLDFANYIVDQWETEEGPKLISKALDNVNVSERFPAPERWWSWENGQKAYEMMSCYDGFLELYKVTKKPEYLDAVILTAENIIATEINIAGSGSGFECWYGTVKNQTRPTYHTMETCVTITWMNLCNKLLELTHDSKYAYEIEKTFYNALMASVKFDASEIAKYSPLEGTRQAGEEQCGMHINCCNANGPRGFVMIPDFGIKKQGNDIFINYYGESDAVVQLKSKNKISLHQSTTYPESGKIEMNVTPEKNENFSLNLRIPSWSEETIIQVNGRTIEKISPGTYLSISRVWTKGDKLSIQFDMRGKLNWSNGHQAITRGPILLARDSRFGDGFVDETMIIQEEEGTIDLTPIENKPPHIWMAFSAPCKTGTDLEGEGSQAKSITFCDFASAGNTWDTSTRYRVWLRKTLNTTQMKYEGY